MKGSDLAKKLRLNLWKLNNYKDFLKKQMLGAETCFKKIDVGLQWQKM